PRYALEVDAEVRAPDRTLPARTSNVSRGGLCFLAAEPLPLGAAVELTLALVFDADTHSEPLALRARIMWCTRLPDGKHQIGAAFVQPTGEQGASVNLLTEFRGRGKTV